ncbi:13872_t:CDS:2 [Entrophospora sp. SA101]|nr:13872_t:CDS:2 [Entrophospora sp. SA101]
MSLLCSNNNNSNSIFENSNVNNPISQLSNKLFQDATTSKRSLILAASSTEQEESRKFPSLVNSSFRTTAMNNYEENEFFPSKNKDNININNDLLEEDEEWSEEWSDEKLTDNSIFENSNVNNPISQLSNKLFQDATTSKRSLILAASSTEQEESRKFPSLVNSSFRTTAMNNYEENEFFPSKNKDNININNDLLEEDEEWSEEWSDEKLTELYIKQHGLDQSLDDYDNNDNLSKNNDLMTFHTNHHDLFQAQLYFD